MIDVPEGRCDLKCLDERRCIHERQVSCISLDTGAEFISCASPRVSVVFLTLAGTGGGVDATPPLEFSEIAPKRVE